MTTLRHPTIIRLLAGISVLVASLACAAVYAVPHDRPVHPCGAEDRTVEYARQGASSAVRATTCRPVRHGPTTGVHVTVLRQ